MAEAARFKPAQMTVQDRSFPVQVNAGGSAFTGWMAYKRIIGLAAYTPQVALPPGGQSRSRSAIGSCTMPRRR